VRSVFPIYGVNIDSELFFVIVLKSNVVPAHPTAAELDALLLAVLDKAFKAGAAYTSSQK